MSNKSILIFSISLLIIVLLIGYTNKTKDNNKKEINNIKIIINEKEYKLNLEKTDEAKDFINNVPSELVMMDLNNNEKYVYLDKVFMNNPINVNYIEKGDLMLYGDNCLVIFYKSFETTYSYTKIGHINNLDNLNDEHVYVKFNIN